MTGMLNSLVKILQREEKVALSTEGIITCLSVSDKSETQGLEYK